MTTDIKKEEQMEKKSLADFFRKETLSDILLKHPD